MNSEHPTDADAAPQFDPRLLELHLRPDAEASAELADLISREAALSSQHAVIGDALAALETVRRVRPPHDLAARAIARARSTPAQTRRRAAWVEQSDRVIRIYNLRDITAVAAMIVLAVGLGVPSVLHMRDRAQRVACSMNLAQVGRAMQAYASTFGDMPFAGWSAASSWQPSRDPAIVRVPNRQHVYPLLRTGSAMAQWLICPSSGDVPMPDDQIRRSAGFLESRNISYATQNMSGVRPSLGVSPQLVVLADDNPLFDDGVALIDFAGPRMGIGDPTRRNSRSHRYDGQNVLQLDGAVRWTTTPDCGVGGDNIWTLENVRTYTGREGPSSKTDTHLLK